MLGSRRALMPREDRFFSLLNSTRPPLAPLRWPGVISLFAKAHVFDRALQVQDFLGQRPHGVLDRLAVMSLRARLCKADRLLQAPGCRLEIRCLPRQSRRADGAPKEFLGLRDVVAREELLAHDAPFGR